MGNSASLNVSGPTNSVEDLDAEVAIQRVQVGSVEDYRTVVQAHHRRLRLWLAGFCPPGVDPDEIAHLAFLTAYRQIGAYRAGTDFFAWLCAFARNLTLGECEKLRRRARNEQNYLELCLAEGQANEVINADAVVESRWRLLSECLASLKRDARELLGWRYGEGLRVQAIAQRLGRSPSAVSVQLFGLRRLLRECVTRKMVGGSPSETSSSYGTV